jgi:hypothetical protein
MNYPPLFTVSLACLVVLSFPAQAEPQNSAKPLIQIKKTQTFALPLDCTPGTDCWVMNYVDMKPDDQENTDPACLSRTYDSHKGTDFAISGGKTMENGVNVLVPLDGTILKVRDGEPDQWASAEQLDAIKAARKECGNAVIIDHGDKTETVYCHMKRGSIVVKPNQKVKQGDVIGQVGLSGLTEFPHLHFGIIKEGKIIDPFTGQDNMQPCGKMKSPLWNKNLELSYTPFVIQNLGFANDIPDLFSIEQNEDSATNIPLNSELLTFWAVLFGVREGDEIVLEIKDPNGKVFARRAITQDSNRARQFYYTGLKTVRNPLTEGAYTGQVFIKRNYKGQILKEEKFSAILVSQN